VETGVVIAGGGPVGLLLAAELGLLGGDVTVIEPNLEPVEQPRAGTLHSRTTELLVRRGFVSADASADPARLATRPFPFAGMPGLTMRAPSTEGPPVYSVPQIELERRFDRRAAETGARILRGHRVTAVRQDADAAYATVEGPDGERTISAPFLVGADGARSLVREQGGFACEERRATMSALITRVRVVDPVFAPSGWLRSAHGWTRIDLDPLGHSRVMTFDFAGPSPDRAQPVTLAELEETFARLAGIRVTFADPRFMARFSDFARLATQYCRGRLLLAGDAAHVHFPIGGQGLNLGIQDAIALGWRLAATLGGAEGLLDAYAAERGAAARSVLENTAAQATMMRSATHLGDVATDLLPIDAVGERLGDMIGGRDLRCPRPGITDGGFVANVRLRSDRGTTSIAQLLLAARPALVDLGDGAAAAAAAPWDAHVTRVTARPDYAVPWRAALIRPDGYLAWTADESDTPTLTRTLTEWFGVGERKSG
jgi:2-polyprenyl-6-methoxyphenol hydroxylase-like FAD-dependent oxidoreductase